MRQCEQNDVNLLYANTRGVKGVRVFDPQQFDREAFCSIKSARYKDAASRCIWAVGKVIDHETWARTCHSFRLMQMGTETGPTAAVDVSVLCVHVGDAVANPSAFDWK